MRTLTEIANSLQLDKGTLPVEQCAWHTNFPEHRTLGYTKIYETYMEHSRNDHINMLEIGVADPRFPLGSLNMWREYFPNGTIHAIDNFWGQPNPPKWVFTEIERLKCKLHLCDQSNRGELHRLCTLMDIKFDYIIDDGSHVSEHVMTSLAYLFPLLRRGGYYFIEDLKQDDCDGKLDNMYNAELRRAFESNQAIPSKYLSFPENCLLKDLVHSSKVYQCPPSSLIVLERV